MKHTGMVLVGIAAGLVTAVVTYAVIRNLQDTSAAASDEDFITEVRAGAAVAPDSEVKTASLSPSTAGEALEPSIDVETHHYHIGTIPNLGIAEGQFMVYNRGKAPLRVSQVTTSCGCTKGQMSKEVIPPGESAPLEVTVDPTKIAGFTSTKTLTLYTNDPKNPTVRVDVTADVDPEMEIDPPVLEFGTVTKGDQVEKTFKVTQLTDQPFEIQDAALMGNVLAYRMEFEEIPEEDWASPGKREYAGKITVLPNAPTGPAVSSIRLNTTLKRLPMMMVPVRGEVIGIYEVHPKSVALRSVELGETIEAIMKITSEHPLEVTQVVTPNEYLKATVRPGGEPNTYVLDLTVADEMDQRFQQDTWTIGIKVRDQEFLEDVRVMALVGGGAPANQ